MTHWRALALCRLDPGLWDTRSTAREAVHICRSHCQVLTECRAWAVGAALTEVTAGGISWNQNGSRRQMDRKTFIGHNVYCRALAQRAVAEEG